MAKPPRARPKTREIILNPLPATIAAFLLGHSSAGLADAACRAGSGSTPVPLVELYTSEGCSSCPPADRWLSTQVGRADINLLAFHVDYWDSIGWPDRFALGESTRRQRERVNAAGGDTVYTPQVMVGAQTRVSWVSKEKFEAAVAAARAVPGPELELALTGHDGDWQLELSSADADVRGTGIRVWLVLALDGQSTRVGAGENRGATLRHDRIVRQIWGPWRVPVRQTVRIGSPGNDHPSWGLVAFAEDATGRTLQSLALHASDCADNVR